MGKSESCRSSQGEGKTSYESAACKNDKDSVGEQGCDHICSLLDRNCSRWRRKGESRSMEVNHICPQSRGGEIHLSSLVWERILCCCNKGRSLPLALFLPQVETIDVMEQQRTLLEKPDKCDKAPKNQKKFFFSVLFVSSKTFQTSQYYE